MKTITISIEAYDRLTAAKRPDESLSDAILRLIPAKTKSPRDIMELAGTWEGDEEEYQRIVADIAKRRCPPEEKGPPQTL